MNPQETVDRFAVLASLRLQSLLRLNSVKHVYEASPGELNSKVVQGGIEIVISRLKKASQPYRGIERFISDDKVMQYIIDPGLLPVVTAVSKDILGKKFLVTRRLAAKKSDLGVVAHVAGFGLRIKMHFNEDTADTVVDWECLYGFV